MKKRLRKKKRVGEFREYGFWVGVRLAKQLDTDAVDNFMDSFIEEAIEENGLGILGGGKGHEFGWAVVAFKSRESASEVQIEAVKQWLVNCSEVAEYAVSQLIDTRYGDFDGPVDWVKK
ncbi:50S ribosome-binding protein YggL [Maridesulfovibrio sp.]|uniref:50S ribosome-binding protein YggL n=1 Tax=unclassified Maridesulfovibrio TaxID=2794999 RepID=UPI003AFFDDE6